MHKYGKYNDQELAALVKKGDQTAFSEIYERYWDKIYLLAANALDNLEEAEECVQDIFCSLWLRRETFQLQYSLYTYLAVAVKYRVINILDREYRKRRRMAQSAHVQAEVYAPSAETLLLEKELMAKLEASVASLPEKCRIVFKMSRQEGKSHKQIAEELNISEKTVNNHLTKAIRDLSKGLSKGTPAFVIWPLLHDLINRS